jgi:6-phosphofructokinase
MKTILCCVSGGVTPVVNSTVAGLAFGNKGRTLSVYGGMEGILGNHSTNVINGNMIKTLRITPGSFFGTSREICLTEHDCETVKSFLKSRKIDAIANVGGNGTIRQSVVMNKCGIPVVSLPKTVDNDIGDREFDLLYYTPGFGSIVKYWESTIDMLIRENAGAYNHDKILIAQTFGRETGFIAGICGYRNIETVMVLLPEDAVCKETLLTAIEDRLASLKRLVIVMSEGYVVSEFRRKKDLFGQTIYGSSYSSACQELSNFLNDNGIQSRIFNPTIEQRQCPSFCDDEVNAFELGVCAGKTMTTGCFYSKNSKGEHVRTSLDREDIFNDFHRAMPEKWIAKGQFNVSNEYRDYLFRVMGGNL